MPLVDSATVLKLLAATPPRIAAASEDLDDAQLQRKPSIDSWSANDVLAHLRACADVWGGSIMAILTQNHPNLRYVSPRTWMRKTNYCELEFASSLMAYTKQRADLLELLSTLDEKDWLRGAIVKATKPREETVFSYAQRMADHEAGHCEQVERILGRGSNPDR